MKTWNLLTTASLVGLAAVSVSLPTAALAQAAQQDATAASADNGTEIVVTAQRREERQVDVPITVTALSQEQLTTANVQSLSGIQKITPALRFDSQAAFAQPSIRGVGTAVTSSGVGSNVGIYIDGFYSQNSLVADFDLLNVTSIQVLKGPQGTLFGRNTTGGAILVTSADPSEKTSVQAKLSYGRFNEFKAQGYATTGITEGVAVDLEGLYRSGNGFQTDLTGNDKIGKHDSWSIRAGIKAQLGSNVSAMFRYTHSHVNDPEPMLAISFVDPVIGLTAANFAAPNQYTTDPDRFAGDVPTFVHTDSDIFQGTIKADLGFADLKSYTQYRSEDNNMSEDLDHVGITIFQGGFGTIDHTFSQELLLNSKPGSRLQWTAGAFYFSNDDLWSFLLDNFYPSRTQVAGSGTTTRTAAIFADLQYEVSPKFFVTVGARYAHDEIDNAYVWEAGVNVPVSSFNPSAVEGAKVDHVTPRVVLRYKPNDESSIYASYTKGYKAPMLDVGGGTGNLVKAEDINAFEVGYKFDNRTISFEAAAYYYDYKNLQVSMFINDPVTGVPSAVILNAANSQIYGLEGQFRYRVSDKFTLTAGANWNHGRYTDFPQGPVYVKCAAIAGCGAGTSYFQAVVPLHDVHMQHSPDFTGNIGANYKTQLAGGTLALSGNLYYSSSFYFGPSGTQFYQGAYETLSARAQWTDPSDRFTVAVFGDNLTNNRYKTQVQYNFYGVGATYSAPVTWGFELGVHFK